MNQFQKGLTFDTVEDLLAFLPEDERRIVQYLRRLIMENLEGVQEKLSYNVPFYALRKNFCFIWPSSVPWGGLKEGVALGFPKGNQLSDDEGLLEKGSRKHVRSITFMKVNEINERIILPILFEAAILDDTFK